jgi:TatD DNase family protein
LQDTYLAASQLFYTNSLTNLFVNIHTHQVSEGGTVIQSLFERFELVQQNGLYSIGLHPCYLSKAGFNELLQWAAHEQVVAVGECGLDKICNTDVELQQQLFAKQIQLANELNKPLIIHCVKAWDEVLKLLQQCTVPVVFHGFNKSKELALQLIAKGYYISFGKALQQERVQKVIAAIPAERILLETDIAELPIKTIYELAVRAIGADEDVFNLQIRNNVTKVFGEKIMNYDN